MNIAKSLKRVFVFYNDSFFITVKQLALSNKNFIELTGLLEVVFVAELTKIVGLFFPFYIKCTL